MKRTTYTRENLFLNFISSVIIIMICAASLSLSSNKEPYVGVKGNHIQRRNSSISSSLTPVKVQSAEVKLLSVNPAETDSSILTVHGPHIAVYDSNVSSKHQLVLFLVGTNGSATATWSMDSIYATMGYHAITLDYENTVVAASFGSSSDSSAFDKYRNEIVTGSPVSDAVNVDSANSILNRFKKLLAYLVKYDSNGGWNEFFKNNEPVWSSIIVAGHSQGSGHAAYIGKMFNVNRVLIFSGPQDFMTAYDAPAPWLSRQSATPSSNYFAFLHQQDPYNVNHQIANCMKLMNTSRPATLTNISPASIITGKWHILVTNISTSSPHGSTILPVFENVWSYMFNAETLMPPSEPVLISPDGITDVPPKVNFIWNSVTGATAYRLQISSDVSFTPVVFDTSTEDTAVNLSAPLHATTKYYWRVCASNIYFTGTFSTVYSFTTGSGITAVNKPKQTPKEFSLLQNYPNPFNPTTIIKYGLPKSEMVALKVYNLRGQNIATLVETRQNAGYYEVSFNAKRLSSGVYFYVLSTDSFHSIHKMLLLK